MLKKAQDLFSWLHIAHAADASFKELPHYKSLKIGIQSGRADRASLETRAPALPDSQMAVASGCSGLRWAGHLPPGQPVGVSLWLIGAAA